MTWAHTTTVALHVGAGAVGIIAGYVALFSRKGGGLHRGSGTVFVYAMPTMALMGAAMAGVWNKAPLTNIPVGLLTAYLVVTGLLTMRPRDAGSRALDAGLLLVSTGICVFLLTVGSMTLARGHASVNGVPAAALFIFASIAGLAAHGDARAIRAGGVHVLRGAARLRRHLWRMCVALLIAAFSFFLGQAKVIPAAFRIYPLLAIPPLVVFTALLYWLWRVRATRRAGRSSGSRLAKGVLNA